MITGDTAGRSVLVTGAGSGIGEACVRRFVAHGRPVVAFDLNVDALTDIAPDSQVLLCRGDVRSAADLTAAVSAGIARFGDFGAVVCNAGIHRSNSILDITDHELQNMLDINVIGTVRTLRAVLPSIIDSGGGSVVLNVSDQWFVGKSNSFGYGLTKGALGQMTRQLAVDLAAKGVRVNAVCPGTIHTPLVDRALQRASERTGLSLDELWCQERADFPIGRVGEPDEVASLIEWLCGPDSGFCTGGHFPIDGGLTAR